MDLSTTIHLPGEALGEVLRTQESVTLLDTEERIRALAKARRLDDTTAGEQLEAEIAALPDDAACATASAFAVSFDLVNLAEEVHRIVALRDRERGLHPAPVVESIRNAVGTLAARGTTPERMAELLRGLRVELVLTAHPTEAKRRTVLSKLQRIAAALRRLADPGRLRAMYTGWPFFRALLDNAEMSLLKADLGIAALYSDLVSDRKLATAIFAAVEAEYARTREALLEATGHAELMDGDPVIQRSVQLRNPLRRPPQLPAGGGCAAYAPCPIRTARRPSAFET